LAWEREFVTVTLVRRIRTRLKETPLFRRVVYNPSMTLLYHLPGPYRREWVSRIQDVLDCPDSAAIERVQGAGSIHGDTQIMHNGLKIKKDSYYAHPMTRMLRISRGVHEPQEEVAFARTLPFIPPGGVMIELGAYWSFYSMWFNQKVFNARNFLVEPELVNLEYGKANFKLNGMTGHFTRAFVGEKTAVAPNGVNIICVDDFARERGIDFIHLLHADVQGFEVQMLDGAKRLMSAGKVGFVFVSTHCQELHEGCLGRLTALNYQILAEAAPKHSYSFDGLIVARHPDTPGPDSISISRKPAG